MTALIIILSIVAFFALLLFIPLRVGIKAQSELNITLSYLFLRFRLYPQKQKKKKKPPQKSAAENGEKKPENDSEKKPGYIQKLFKEKGTAGAIRELTDILKTVLKQFFKLLKHLKFNRLFLTVHVADGDAAKAAIEYGAVNAAVFPLLALVDTAAGIKRKKVDIYCEFEGESSLSADIRFSLRPIFLLTSALAALFKIIALNQKGNGGKNE